MERLTTGRLLLRAFEPEDLQSLYAYCSEPDTGIHADKKPHESIEESRQLLNQLMQEDLTWAICDKVNGKNIGAVWLREDHRRRRDKSRCRVLGYLLDKGWWGQGLMTEAVSCVVDYAFYGAAGGEFPEEITEIAKEGIVAYKSFLHQAPEGREKEFVGLTMANDAEILVGMREIAKTGLMMASHAENNDLITYNIAKMRAEGHTKPLDHCKSRPPITEYSTVAKLIMFAKETGCTLELAHMSTVESMELARKARFEGQKVFVETCPHYLLLDETALEKYGPFARCNPPLRPKETVEKLWDYVNDGTIDFIGSDHGPFLLSEKEQGNEDIFKAFCGAPGVDLRLPLMLDAAARGKTTIERVVELLCVNPARCFNIYPQKGTISAGADADLVVFDMNDTTVVDRNKSYSKARETARIFDGWELGCKLNYTVVRGRVLMEDGVVDPDCAGYGQLVTPQK